MVCGCRDRSRLLDIQKAHYPVIPAKSLPSRRWGQESSKRGSICLCPKEDSTPDWIPASAGMTRQRQGWTGQSHFSDCPHNLMQISIGYGVTVRCCAVKDGEGERGLERMRRINADPFLDFSTK